MTSYEDAVFVAAKTGSVEDTQNLLAIAAVNWTTRDPLGNTPLHYAAAAGHAEVVKLLVASKKVDVNAQNGQGETPLHKVAEALRQTDHHVAAADALIEGGANIDTANKAGQTALDVARDGPVRDLIANSVVVPGFDPDAEDDEPADDDEEDEDEDDDE